MVVSDIGGSNSKGTSEGRRSLPALDPPLTSQAAGPVFGFGAIGAWPRVGPVRQRPRSTESRRGMLSATLRLETDRGVTTHICATSRQHPSVQPNGWRSLDASLSLPCVGLVGQPILFPLSQGGMPAAVRHALLHIDRGPPTSSRYPMNRRHLSPKVVPCDPSSTSTLFSESILPHRKR